MSRIAVFRLENPFCSRRERFGVIKEIIKVNGLGKEKAMRRTRLCTKRAQVRGEVQPAVLAVRVALFL